MRIGNNNPYSQQSHRRTIQPRSPLQLKNRLPNQSAAGAIQPILKISPVARFNPKIWANQDYYLPTTPPNNRLLPMTPPSQGFQKDDFFAPEVLAQSRPQGLPKSTWHSIQVQQVGSPPSVMCVSEARSSRLTPNLPASPASGSPLLHRPSRNGRPVEVCTSGGGSQQERRANPFRQSQQQPNKNHMLIIANEPRGKSNCQVYSEEGERSGHHGGPACGQYSAKHNGRQAVQQSSPTSVSHQQQKRNLRYIDKLISKQKMNEMEQSIKIEDYYRKTNTRLNVTFNRHVQPPNVDDLSFEDLKLRVLTPTNPIPHKVAKKRKLEVLIRDVDSASKDNEEASSNEHMTTLENGAVNSSSVSDHLMNPLTHLTEDSAMKLNFIQVSEESFGDSTKQMSRNHPKTGSKHATVFTRSKNDKARQNVWSKYDPHLHLSGQSCLRDSMLLNQMNQPPPSVTASPKQLQRQKSQRGADSARRHSGSPRVSILKQIYQPKPSKFSKLIQLAGGTQNQKNNTLGTPLARQNPESTTEPSQIGLLQTNAKEATMAVSSEKSSVMKLGPRYDFRGLLQPSKKKEQELKLRPSAFYDKFRTAAAQGAYSGITRKNSTQYNSQQSGVISIPHERGLAIKLKVEHIDVQPGPQAIQTLPMPHPTVPVVRLKQGSLTYQSKRKPK